MDEHGEIWINAEDKAMTRYVNYMPMIYNTPLNVLLATLCPKLQKNVYRKTERSRIKRIGQK
jgi:hypothetical protein